MNRKTTPLLLLGCSLLIFSSSVVSIPILGTPFPNLDPVPDGAEYFAAANTLYEDATYGIHLAGNILPPRYPFGYSWLMVPWFHLGFEPITIPFLVNKGSGLLLILLMFTVLWHHQEYLGAGISVMLLTTLAAFMILARSPMSEISSTVLLFLSYYLIFVSLSRGNHWPGILGSLLLGLSLSFRLSNLVYANVILIAPLVGMSRPLSSRLLAVLKMGTAFVLGTTPLLVYNFRSFGHPLETGYSFWIPGYSSPTKAFHPSYLEQNLRYFWSELVQKETIDSPATLFGEGSYFGPALIALVAIAIVGCLHNRLHLGFLISGAVSGVAFCFYFFQDARLIFPLLVLAIPMVSTRLVGLARQPGWAIGKVGLMLLVICHLCVFPGRRGDGDLDRYLRSRRWLGQPIHYHQVMQLNSLRPPGPALILTDMNVPYVYALTEAPRIVVPSSRFHDYRFNPKAFSFGDQDIPIHINQALDEGATVYLLNGDGNFRPEKNELFPSLPAGYHWSTLYDAGHGRVVARLVPQETVVRRKIALIQSKR